MDSRGTQVMSERSFKAVSVPTGGGATGAAMSAAAPIGAVKTKDRERYARTALIPVDASTVTLVTELPGTVLLQQKVSGGTWATIRESRVGRKGRTPISIPDGAADGGPGQFRVVFSPKNPDLNAWVSESI
jgi:hypothetical protein